jgi:hypothetical protein
MLRKPILRRLRQYFPRAEEALSTQLATLKSITVEVQEAQCFLMLACQAALLAAVDNRSELIAAKTLYGLYKNLDLLTTLALGGLLPVSFLLFIQYLIGMASNYILALSALTIVVSSCSLALIPSLDSKHLIPFTGVEDLPKCGGHPPVPVNCERNSDRSIYYLTGNNQSEFEDYLPIIIFCLVVVISILLLKLLPSIICFWSKIRSDQGRVKRHAHIRSIKFSSIKLRFSKYLSRHPRQLRIYGQVKKYGVVFISFAVFCYLLGGYFAMLLRTFKSGVPRDWGFGQVVALFLWAPVIVKYLYWSFCKCHTIYWDRPKTNVASWYGKPFERPNCSSVSPCENLKAIEFAGRCRA